MDNFQIVSDPSTDQKEQSSVDQDVISEYKSECRRVRNGCNFDLSKCFKDGKPLIIDGSHIDPDCYLEYSEHEIDGTNKIEYRIVTEQTESDTSSALGSMQ